MQPVESSLIAALGYDEDSRELHIQFRKGGATYAYGGVQPHIYENLTTAPSVGKFFLQEIKGVYPGKKMEEDKMMHEGDAMMHQRVFIEPDELDVDGRMDAKGGVVFIGNAKRQSDGTWRCLANVGGALCIVEVKITFEEAA